MSFWCYCVVAFRALLWRFHDIYLPGTVLLRFVAFCDGFILFLYCFSGRRRGTFRPASSRSKGGGINDGSPHGLAPAYQARAGTVAVSATVLEVLSRYTYLGLSHIDWRRPVAARCVLR